MLRKLLSPKWLVTFAMIFTMLVSVTLVSAHGGDLALIHACVKSSSGDIKIVDANATCPSNYRALDWNIQGPIGPAGPMGPQGLQGEQGPQGVQGPAGISGLEVVTVYSGTQDAFRIDVSAECPAGKQVLGGGFATAGNNVNVSVAANAPYGSSWVVTLVQDDLTARLWSVQAYAICANVAP